MKCFRSSPDETLLLLARRGNFTAEFELHSRHYSLMRKYAVRAIPDDYWKLDRNELAYTFELAFLNAYQTYRFGQALFRNYLQKVFKHEMLKSLFRANMPTSIFRCISLDQPWETNLGADPICLHDIVGDGEDPWGPKPYYDYCETLAKLKMLPKGLNRQCLDLIGDLVEGYSLREAAAKNGYTIAKARHKLRAYREFIKSQLSHPKIDYFS